MQNSTQKKSLLDAYRFKGFKTSSKIKSHLMTLKALVITLVRRQKKRFAALVVRPITSGMTIESRRPVTSLQATTKSILSLKFAEFFARSATL